MTSRVPLLSDAPELSLAKGSAKRSREQRQADGRRTITLHLKVRPEAWPWLDQAAREVNFVWNWANETSRKAVQTFVGPATWLSGFDLNNLSAGASESFERIGADVIQRVNGEYALRRRQFKKLKLRFRASGGRKRALGWVPFKATNLRVATLEATPTQKRMAPQSDEKKAWIRANQRKKGTGCKVSWLGPRQKTRLTFMGKTIRLFQMDRFLAHRAEGYTMGEGNFAQNALGEWFLNVSVRLPEPGTYGVPALEVAPHEVVGLDPGLTALFTSSRGEVYAANRSYRDLEPKIASLQRNHHKKQAKRLMARAKHIREDALQKATRHIVNQNQIIKLGDTTPTFLRSGNHAKSALDSGLGKAKLLLFSKGHWAGRSVHVVPEKFSTQDCSECRSRTGPKGQDGLGVRVWVCSNCGVTHDRDVNAAKNIEKAPICAEVSASFTGNTRGPSVPSVSQSSAMTDRERTDGTTSS